MNAEGAHQDFVFIIPFFTKFWIPIDSQNQISIDLEGEVLGANTSGRNKIENGLMPFKDNQDQQKESAFSFIPRVQPAQ
jgi:hypothetical protein